MSRAICTGAPGKEQRKKGEGRGEEVASEEEMWKEGRKEEEKSTWRMVEGEFEEG